MHKILALANTMAPIGARGNDQYSMNVLVVSTAPAASSRPATQYGDLQSSVSLATKKEAYTINYVQLAGNGNAVVRQTTSMAKECAFGHAIVLPGGKIFLVGGQTNLHLFEDKTGVLKPELFDLNTGQYQLLASMKVACNCHSVALLTHFGPCGWAGEALIQTAA
ncbi:hypothetical protein DFJ77DRAFT_45232 [Powellomyces hirtus]|nr:hypothetical protein DFJ77DRAFT_45232 [Powellomyces hirtus]